VLQHFSTEAPEKTAAWKMCNIVWKFAHRIVGCRVQVSGSFTEKEDNLDLIDV